MPRHLNHRPQPRVLAPPQLLVPPGPINIALLPAPNRDTLSSPDQDHGDAVLRDVPVPEERRGVGDALPRQALAPRRVGTERREGAVDLSRYAGGVGRVDQYYALYHAAEVLRDLKGEGAAQGPAAEEYLYPLLLIRPLLLGIVPILRAPSREFRRGNERPDHARVEPPHLLHAPLELSARHEPRVANAVDGAREGGEAGVGKGCAASVVEEDEGEGGGRV